MQARSAQRATRPFVGYGTTGSFERERMFTPLQLLPSQSGLRSPLVERPEMRLLWSIFVTGIEEYCQAIVRGDALSSAFCVSRAWIYGDGDGPTSFAHLCELFSVDPGRLRRALLEFRLSPRPELLRVVARRAWPQSSRLRGRAARSS